MICRGRDYYHTCYALSGLSLAGDDIPLVCYSLSLFISLTLLFATNCLSQETNSPSAQYSPRPSGQSSKVFQIITTAVMYVQQEYIIEINLSGRVFLFRPSTSTLNKA